MSTAMSSTERLIFCCILVVVAAVFYQQNADLRLQIEMLTLKVEVLKKIVDIEDNNLKQMVRNVQDEIRKHADGNPISSAFSHILEWFVPASRRLLP